ncbi:unnamed protein product [Amoebophrya sp. A25]|nr:unnamed protein product [Amoebophrya sp. A25]|eukprot:GSA25T00021276001.1
MPIEDDKEWVTEPLIWHEESLRMGTLENDSQIFVKNDAYDDLLSTLSEDRIRHGGRHRYCIRFRERDYVDQVNGFSMADGIGFVFSNKLPCAKNIQRIQSVFVSRKGIVCVRRKADVTRCKEFSVRPFEDRDYIWCEIDLTRGNAAFWVEGPETNGKTNGPPKGTVFYYGDCFPQFAQQKLDMGFITAVIKFQGVAADAICYQKLVPKSGLADIPVPGESSGLSTQKSESSASYHSPSMIAVGAVLPGSQHSNGKNGSSGVAPSSGLSSATGSHKMTSSAGPGVVSGVVSGVVDKAVEQGVNGSSSNGELSREQIVLPSPIQRFSPAPEGTGPASTLKGDAPTTSTSAKAFM